MKLVYLSPVPWHSISQRPHFFVQQALEQGINEVLWVEPYPGRLPVWQDLVPSRHTPEPAGLDLLPGVQVAGRRMLPVEPLGRLFHVFNGGRMAELEQQIAEFVAGESALLVVGKPSRLALSLLGKPWWWERWFDAMDNYPAFYRGLSRRSMEAIEQLLATGVDRLFCSSHPLLEKFSTYGNAELILNASSDCFKICENNQKAKEELCFGYIGTISEWFDWEWVKALAVCFPEATIKLVGPLKVLKPMGLPSNVNVLPAIPHYQVAKLLSTFSAGLIPFLNNSITRYVDPVKFYEYQAASLPVFSSSFGEMAWHAKESSVYISDKPDRDEILSVMSIIMPSSRITWSQRFSGLFSSHGCQLDGDV